MTDPRLTHFSSDELMFLYLTLEEKRITLHKKMEEIESMPESITRVELWAFFSSQLDYCTQLITKVDEAQKIDRARQILLNEN